jgi:hypothetical protein
MKRFRTKVVGVTFVDSYPQGLYRLKEIAEQRWLAGSGPKEDAKWGSIEPLPAVLIREPDNPHDANAIEVHIPSLGRYGMIGHLPAVMAARLAPLMDEGTRYQAAITVVLIHPEHSERPGIEVVIDRVDDPMEDIE